MSKLLKTGKYFSDNAVDTDFLKAHEHLESHGPRHVPVSHALILEKFRDKCESSGLMLFNEQGALSKDGERYMYIADIEPEVGTAEDFNLSVGFRSFNDESAVFQMSCGVNLLFSDTGIQTSRIIPSYKKHTATIHDLLDSKIAVGLERFNHDSEITKENIAFLKNVPYSDELLGRLLIALNRTKQIGSTNTMKIINEVDEIGDKEKSAWKIMMACSIVAGRRMMNPLQAMNSSKLMHDELMKLIKPDYKPLGDVDFTEAA